MSSYCMLFADWSPLIKNPGYAYTRIQEIFMFAYFPLQPIKTQCCP